MYENDFTRPTPDLGRHDYEPLAEWEEELLSEMERPIADITFTRFDGRQVIVRNANFDSVSDNGQNKGIIAVDVYDEREIVHVPYVESWTVDPVPYFRR